MKTMPPIGSRVKPIKKTDCVGDVGTVLKHYSNESDVYYHVKVKWDHTPKGWPYADDNISAPAISDIELSG
jgi:hypothetical protein